MAQGTPLGTLRGSERPHETPRPPRTRKKRETDEKRAERLEELIDLSILELIESKAQKVNEGNNGVILLCSLEVVREAVGKILEQKGISIKGDAAIKVLKVYTRGSGKREFELQRLAHEKVVALPEANDYAQVPQPLFHRDIALTPESQRRLESLGVKSGQKRIEVIMMDFIQADDLATHLYKEVVRRHPALAHLRREVDGMDIRELGEAVAEALAFAVPGGKARNEEERDFEQRKVFARNADSLFRYLRQSGYVFDERILSQIERTVGLLHDEGIFLRDAHHRNFLVAQKKGEDGVMRPVSYVIDFGNGARIDTASGQDPYEGGPDGKGRYSDDFAVVRELRAKLGKEPERDASAGRKASEALRKKLRERSAPWREFLVRANASLANEHVDPATFYMSCPSQPSRADLFIAALYEIAEAQPDKLPAMQEICKKLRRIVMPADLPKLEEFIRG